MIEDSVYSTYVSEVLSVPAAQVKKKNPDFEVLRPLFGWLPVETVKRTWECTTQMATIPISTILKKHYKSQNPAFNVARRNEPVATDTIFSDTPAIDSGCKSAQLFVGTESLVTDAYPMKTNDEFVNTLEDNIRERGAMTKLISDRAQAEISNKVQDILRTLVIKSWQSEPHQQHQNFAERRYQTIKTVVNTILDRVGAPAYTWLLCLLYVCFLLNNVYNHTIKAVPIQKLNGSTNDISPLLRFYFYEPVYYKLDDSDFPSGSREKRGYFVGIAENVGHAMTFKILTDDTNKVIYRSNVRPAHTVADRNRRLDLLGGESDPVQNSPKVVKHRFENSDGDLPNTYKMPVVNPTDLVGRSFLMDEQPDGTRFRAKVVSALQQHEHDLDAHPTRRQFICRINGDKEEIISYNEILNYLNRDAEDEVLWKFKYITGHQGPLKQTDPDYKGSTWNVRVEWESGEITYEPLEIIAADDPVSCADYAKRANLLDIDGWKRFRRIARRNKKLTRMINQAKLRSFKTAPKYMFGYEVPNSFKRAVELDKLNGNTLWQDAIKLELRSLFEYDTFDDLGPAESAIIPKLFKRIRVHMVYAVKHDGRHKARLVADGNLTAAPIESVYSGVVSLRGLRIVAFLAELNSLELWATDVGNAYLEAETKEKVYIVAGPEFGDLCGHVLRIHKALYGLRSSGKMWSQRLASCLREMGYFPCKAEPDIWMRAVGSGSDRHYEYIAVYVDDLAIASRNPKTVTDMLMSRYSFKLKGTGPISYHLGMEFFRDKNGVLCISARRYVEKMLDTYKRLFGKAPSTRDCMSPIADGDHPELDTSEFLEGNDVVIYQSLIGAMQWAISIGRLDITTGVMTMSSFRTMPRLGHLNRLHRFYGYLLQFKDAAIRVRVGEPDYSQLPEQDFDWSHSVYENPKELIPKDIPAPLGRFVQLTHYCDANLMHDLSTGRSVTGILHFLNKTPIDWYSKKQATVETATYGSEFVAARTCVEQIIDLRLTLRYLGVPIRDRSMMFGDNESVVKSSTIPQGKLHKRHTALSFHRVREAVAAKMIAYHFLSGKENPADCVSKNWTHAAVYDMAIKPILFYVGDTGDLLLKKK